MSATIVEQLKNLIVDELDVNLEVEEIDENVSLFDEGLGFDSIATVEFISLVEKHFDVDFDDSELDPTHFSSLIVLAEFIANKLEPSLVG